MALGKEGFRIEIVNKSKEVYNKLFNLGFCFNNGSEEEEKLQKDLPKHLGYVFRAGNSMYVGSNLDYETESDYYEYYAKFTITEDEFLNYIRFKNLKYKMSKNKLRLLGDLWKSYEKRLPTAVHSSTNW